MLRKPKLKTFLTVFPISETKWGLRGGSNELCRVELKSETALRTFGALLPRLTGKYTTEEILDDLESQGISRGATEALLRHLLEFRCLEEADSVSLSEEQMTEHRDQITFFSHFTAEGGASLQATLGTSRVAVLGDGGLAAVISRQLKEAGVGKVEPRSASRSKGATEGGESTKAEVVLWPADDLEDLPDLFVVPQEGFDPELMEAMDTFSKKHEVPWMLIRSMSTQEGWVGPLFVPKDTASYLSLEARLRGNLPFFEEYQAFDSYVRKSGHSGPPCGGLRATHEVLAGIAVTEVIKYLSGYEVPFLAGRFLTLDLATWESEVHDVLRVPRLDDEGAYRPQPFPWKEALYGESGTHDRRA